MEMVQNEAKGPLRCTIPALPSAPTCLQSRSARPVSCYALFKPQAASKPQSWLSLQIHIHIFARGPQLVLGVNPRGAACGRGRGAFPFLSLIGRLCIFSLRVARFGKAKPLQNPKRLRVK